MLNSLSCAKCRGQLRGMFKSRRIALQTAGLLGWRRRGGRLLCPDCKLTLRVSSQLHDRQQP